MSPSSASRHHQEIHVFDKPKMLPRRLPVNASAAQTMQVPRSRGSMATIGLGEPSSTTRGDSVYSPVVTETNGRSPAKVAGQKELTPGTATVLTR